MRKINLIILLIISLSFIISIYYYPTLPDKIANHWDINGEVNGYMNKFWGLFLLPIITLAIFVIFLLIPIIDPLKKNIKRFQKSYDYLVLILIIFLFYVHILTLAWNLGYLFNMTKMIIPAIGLLFVYLGMIMKNLKRNWFIGIRTPWTLSNDKVWKKTHALGGKLFVLSGIIMFIGIFFQNYLLYFIFIPITITVIFIILYSYLEYRKIKK